MPLTIHLRNPQHHYHGNEVIRGHVVFESSSLTELQDIRIIFTGISKAKVQKVKGSGAPAANYRSKCVLFEKERILLSLNSNGQGGEQVLGPGKYEWPFEFIFPTTAQSSVNWAEKVPFRSDAEHPLPPTFAIEAGDVERKVDCKIEYRLEAKVLKPQRGIFPSRTPLFHEEVRLNLLPEFAVADGQEDNREVYRHQKEQLFDIRSILLLPENRGRGLRMPEKIRGWLFPSQLPRFSFTTTFSYPTRVVQSAPLECSWEITPHMESASISAVPEILMRSISITATSQTAARAAPSIMGAIFAELDDKIEILSKTSLHLPVSGTVDLGQVFGPLAFRHTDVSFRTFNIARTYRLYASIVLECAGKTNEFKAADLPFEVVANVEKMEKRGVAAEVSGLVGDAPPVYTPSCRCHCSGFTFCK